MDPEIQVKASEAQSSTAGIGGQKHVGEHWMGRPGGDSTTHKLQGSIQLGLRADHFHRAEGQPKHRQPTVSQAKGKRNGHHQRSALSAVLFFKESKEENKQPVVEGFVESGENQLKVLSPQGS